MGSDNEPPWNERIGTSILMASGDPGIGIDTEAESIPSVAD